MTERRRTPKRRKADSVAKLLLVLISQLTKITTACSGLFLTGAAAIITARGAWVDIVNAFLKK